jgi:hypothetical protein
MGAYLLGLLAISAIISLTMGDSITANGYVDRVLADDRVLVWFDIDNTLYPASAKIGQEMGVRIRGEALQTAYSNNHTCVTC